MMANTKLSESQKSKVTAFVNQANFVQAQLSTYVSAIAEERGLPDADYGFDLAKLEFIEKEKPKEERDGNT